MDYIIAIGRAHSSFDFRLWLQVRKGILGRDPKDANMEQFVEPNISSLLDEVLDAAIALTGAQMGNIQLLDRGKLKIVTHRGFSAQFLKFFAEVEKGHAACGEASRRRAQIVVEDVTWHPIFMGTQALEEVLAAGVRAVQSTPIIESNGGLIGVLSTHFRQPHRPDLCQLRLLDLLARGAAAAIERDAVKTKLAVKDRHFEMVSNSLATPIAQCSRDLKYVFVNKAFADFIGLSAATIEGRSMMQVLGQKAFDTIRPHVDRVLAGESLECEANIDFPRIGMRHMQVKYVPYFETNIVRDWFMRMTDITRAAAQ